MKQEYPDADVELIRGKGGIFDVTLDGHLLFSKHRVGRFPEHTEVLRAAKELQL